MNLFVVLCVLQLLKQVQQDFKSGWCTDEESMKTIKDVFKRTGK